MASELWSVLHEEINCLPREARMALVVCDLEGCTPRSAARQLGWPVARLRRRLAHARRRLQERVALRGVLLSASREIHELLHVGKSRISRRLIEATVALASCSSGRRQWQRPGYFGEDLAADRTHAVGVWSPEKG
jgi:hypothetical protein